MQRSLPGLLKPYIDYVEETHACTTNRISLFESFLDGKNPEQKIDALTIIGADIADLSRLLDQCAEQDIKKLVLKGCKIINDVLFDPVNSLTTLMIEECTFVLSDTQHIQFYIQSCGRLKKLKEEEAAVQQQIINLKLVIQSQENDIRYHEDQLDLIHAVIQTKKTGQSIVFDDREKQALFIDLLKRGHTAAEFERTYVVKSAAVQEMRAYLQFYQVQLEQQKEALKDCSLKTASTYELLQSASDQLQADAHAIFACIGNMYLLKALSVTNSQVSIIHQQEELDNLSVVNDDSIERFVANSLFSGQSLNALDVSNNNLSCAAAYEIARLFTLKQLDISDNDMGDVGFKAFSTQNTDRSSSTTTQFQLDEDVAILEQSENLPLLITLDANNIGITNDALVDFKKASLQVLNIEGNDDVTVVSNQLFLSQCPALREVNTSDSVKSAALSETEKRLDELCEEIEAGAALFEAEKQSSLENTSSKKMQPSKKKSVDEREPSITLVTGTLFVKTIVKTIEVTDLVGFGLVKITQVNNLTKKH